MRVRSECAQLPVNLVSSVILNVDVERADVKALDLVGLHVERTADAECEGLLRDDVAVSLPDSVKLSTVMVSVPPTRVSVIGLLRRTDVTTFFVGATASNSAE
jgi:hypothetical protein